MNALAERVDWHAIKDRIDLEAVAVGLMGPPQGRTGSRGTWWTCPFHADRNPSLNVDPERRRWKCWGCSAHGDAVELAMRLNPSMAFPEAVRLVAELSGIFPARTGKVAQRFATKPPTAAVRPAAKPSGLPLENALDLVADASERLWTPQGSEALAYLHDRGLTDETIRAARLGYVASAAVPTRDGDRTYRVSGVAVPWHDGDRLAKVSVRRLHERDQKSKYMSAFEDRPSFYSLESIRPGKPLVVVEGEFDALLLGQELAGLACVVTMGSASVHTADDIRRAARSRPSLFAAHDADEAGDKAAARWPARAVRVRPPDGFKDWSELHASGFNRIRYLWGRFLPLGNPPKDEDFAPPVAGLWDYEPDWYATAERAAIQADTGQQGE